MWGIVGTASQGGLRFLCNMLVGRIAGPAALGVFASAISVALLLSLLWPTSIGSAASKFLARSRGAGDSQGTRAVAAHLARRSLQVTAFLVVVAAILWWRVYEPGAGPMEVISVVLLLAGYSGYAFTRGVQYGVGQVRRGTQWDVISSVLGLLGMVVLLVAGVRDLVLLLPLAASYGIYTVACWPHGASHRTNRLVDIRLRREIDGFITLAAVGSLVSSGFLQLAMITARSSVPLHEAGMFAAALTLATPASLLAGSLSLVLFPTMAEAWGRGRMDQFRVQTDLATKGLFSVMVGIFGALALCSRLIVSLLWGDRYADSAAVLPILLAAVCLSTMGVSSVNAIMTAGRRGMVVTTCGGVVGVAVGALVWLLTVPSLGITGIALGYLAGVLVSFTIAFTLCWRQGRHRWVMLTLRTAAAFGLVGAVCVVSSVAGWGSALQVAAGLVFLLGWGAISLRDVRPVLPGRARATG